MDAETREALEVLRDALTANATASELESGRDALTHIEQTLRDLSEQRDEWKERAVLTGSEAAALAERVERAERDVRVWMNEKAGAVRRAEAAEAESARLRGHLERVLAWEHYDPEYADDVTMREHDDEYDAARAALSPPTDGEAT